MLREHRLKGSVLVVAGVVMVLIWLAGYAVLVYGVEMEPWTVTSGFFLGLVVAFVGDVLRHA
jgi:hypothetical protein